MAISFSQQWPADGAVRDQLASADQLGVEAAVIGDTEETARSVTRIATRRAAFGHHPLRLGEVHRHRLFAKHMLARAERGNCGIGV